LDLDDWYADASWVLTVEESAKEPDFHFTEIKIEKLYVDPSMYSEELRDRLADRFGPFIDGGDAVIRINDSRIAPMVVHFLPASDPNLKRAIEDSKVHGFRKRLEFSLAIDEMIVTGWVDFLAKRSLGGKFGFNVYRGRRLIQPYVKI